MQANPGVLLVGASGRFGNLVGRALASRLGAKLRVLARDPDARALDALREAGATRWGGSEVPS